MYRIGPIVADAKTMYCLSELKFETYVSRRIFLLGSPSSRRNSTLTGVVLALERRYTVLLRGGGGFTINVTMGVMEGAAGGSVHVSLALLKALMEAL